MQRCFIDFKTAWTPVMFQTSQQPLDPSWEHVCTRTDICPRPTFLIEKVQISQFLCSHFYSSESRTTFRLCNVCRLWLCHLLSWQMQWVQCWAFCCWKFPPVLRDTLWSAVKYALSFLNKAANFKSQLCQEPATGIATRINTLLKTWNPFLSR